MLRARLLGLDRMTWGLIAAFWGLLFAVGAVTERAHPPLFGLTPSTLLQLGALRGPLSSFRELWRIATCWLVHVDLLHLLSNLVVLLVVSRLWPPRARLLLALGLGILGAGGVTLLLAPNQAIVSCGGSGVLLALLMPLWVWSRSWPRRFVPLGLAALILGGGILSSVDWAAHLGGVVAGLVFTGIVDRPAVTA